MGASNLNISDLQSVEELAATAYCKFYILSHSDEQLLAALQSERFSLFFPPLSWCLMVRMR